MSMSVIIGEPGKQEKVVVPHGTQAKGPEAIDDYVGNEAKKRKLSYPPLNEKQVAERDAKPKSKAATKVGAGDQKE